MPGLEYLYRWLAALLYRSSLPTISAAVIAKILLIAAAAAVTVYGSYLIPDNAPFFALALGVVSLLLLPSKAQFVLLLLALQLPTSFPYTTLNLGGGLDIQLSDVLVVSLGARAILVWWTGGVKQSQSLKPWIVFLLLFIVWTGIAQTVSHLGREALPPFSWTGWARSLSYLILVPIFGVMTPDRKSLTSFLSLAMWLVVMQGVIGLFLKFFGPGVGISTASLEILGGLKYPEKYGTSSYQISGLLGSAASLGLAAAVFLCIWLARWLSRRWARVTRVWSELPSILLLIATVVFTLSRRSILGAGFGAGLVFLLSRRGPTTRGTFVAIAILAMVLLLGPTLVERFQPELFPAPGQGREQTSLGLRLTYWKESVPLILDHPVFGLGWGMFGTIRGQPNTYSHSLYTETALAYGIPGLLLLIAALGLVIRDSRLVKAHGAEISWFGLGMMGAVAATAASGIFDVNLLTPQARLFWVAAGIQLCAVRTVKAEYEELIRPKSSHDPQLTSHPT